MEVNWRHWQARVFDQRWLRCVIASLGISVDPKYLGVPVKTNKNVSWQEFEKSSWLVISVDPRGFFLTFLTSAMSWGVWLLVDLKVISLVFVTLWGHSGPALMEPTLPVFGVPPTVVNHWSVLPSQNPLQQCLGFELSDDCGNRYYYIALTAVCRLVKKTWKVILQQ